MSLVALEGMHFFAYHGLFEAEKQHGNDFEVDVWVETGKAVANTDRIEDALDYGAIYAVTRKAMEIRRDLLETLVGEIGATLRQQFPSVVWIKVRVSKANPPLGGVCKRSYVEDLF